MVIKGQYLHLTQIIEILFYQFASIAIMSNRHCLSFSSSICFIAFLARLMFSNLSSIFLSCWKHCRHFSCPKCVALYLREDINGKKHFLSGIARIRGGGFTHAQIFWPSFKSLFLQKCQSIDLLTVFQIVNMLISPSPPHIFANSMNFDV